MASASALLLVGAGGANAGILNASFEHPVVPAFTQGFIQDWTGSAGQPFYYGVASEPSLPQPFPDGNQGGYVNNFAGGAGVPASHSIAQQLTDVLMANTHYTLSGYLGWRNDNAQSTGGIGLYAGGSVVDGDVIGGVLLGSSSVTLTQNQWVLGSVGYNAAALDPNLGRLLSVRLLGTSKSARAGIARFNPDTQEIENIEILFFSKRGGADRAFDLPVVAELHRLNEAEA